MFIGDILLAHKLVSEADIAAALERQKDYGGRLGDNLVAMGRLSSDDLDAIIHAAPPSPKSLEEAGLDVAAALNLGLKAMYSGDVETPSAMGDFLRLPHRVMQSMVMHAQERKLSGRSAPPV